MFLASIFKLKVKWCLADSLKVADFGLARTIEDPDEKQPEGKVAVRWTAPEASLQKVRFKTHIGLESWYFTF